MKRELLEDSLLRLMNYIEGESYRGYDPYDGLMSPLMKLPFLRSNKFIRFGEQQFLKRFPLNLRPLLFVRKGYNPVTLGLCVQAYTNLLQVYPDQKSLYQSKIDFLINELEKLIPKGFSGVCWGYDFDWESRNVKIPAYQPTIVATGFITNGLFKNYLVTGNRKALELVISSTKFILNDINKTYDEEGDFCFSYSPFDKQVVFNASMKGVRTFAQAYSVTKDIAFKESARKATAFVMKHQQPDGSWVYSKNKKGGWVDNYHTGYVLDCLDEYVKCCEDDSFKENLERGYKYYKENFFENNRIPKFYDRNTYPVDCTSAAQSILSLMRFNGVELAENVAEWMIQNMQSTKGNFYFRKFKTYTVKTSFMRWSNAWMFVGLSEIALKIKKENLN